MDAKKRGPIGIELVKRGLINEDDINKALEYQREHPNKRIVEVISLLNLCDEYSLVEALGDILDERAIILTQSDIKINPADYISIDVIK